MRQKPTLYQLYDIGRAQVIAQSYDYDELFDRGIAMYGSVRNFDRTWTIREVQQRREGALERVANNAGKRETIYSPPGMRAGQAGRVYRPPNY